MLNIAHSEIHQPSGRVCASFCELCAKVTIFTGFNMASFLGVCFTPRETVDDNLNRIG